jgi:hypothetical protein
MTSGKSRTRRFEASVIPANVGRRCDPLPMYDDEVRAAARAAIASGESLNSISKREGISGSTLRN